MTDQPQQDVRGRAEPHAPGVRTAAEMFAALNRTLSDAAGRVFPRGCRVALLGYPRHTNVGDSAIWLGERRLLRRIGAKVIYFARRDYYDPGRIRKRIGDGVVAIHGGGNIGDLWPEEQEFRERVLADFADTPVVQLSQSIHFDDPANVARVRDVFAHHRKLTLFVRDHNSLRIARERLGLDPVLVPDMAFALWPLKRVGRAVAPYVVQCRTDKESGLGEPIVESFDWLEPTDRAEQWLDDYLNPARRLMRLGDTGAVAYGAWLDRLCALRVRRGLRLLSRGEVAISDRLHGVLMSLLAGIPAVAVDNRIGKLCALLDTWLTDCPGLEVAPSIEEAIRIARHERAQP